MTRLCIKDCIIDGLCFISYVNYTIKFNPIINKLMIYNPFGYTTIDKNTLDRYFL